MVDWRDPSKVKSPLALETSLAGLIVVSEDIRFTLNEYTSAQTLSADNYLALFDCSSGEITVTLPAAVNHKNRVYTIKKIDSSLHKVKVDANGSETIDGETTIDLGLQYDYLTIVSDATEWHIIGGGNVKIEDILNDMKDLLREQRSIAESQEQILKDIRFHQDMADDQEVRGAE